MITRIGSSIISEKEWKIYLEAQLKDEMADFNAEDFKMLEKEDKSSDR